MRAVLRGLERHDLRPIFFTTLAISAHLVGTLSGAPRLANELSRRIFAELSPSQIRTVPGRELVRQIARRVGLAGLVRHESGWASVDRVYRAIDRHVACAVRRRAIRPELVYAYEDSALDTFSENRRREIVSVYELPTAYWRLTHRIFCEERELQPGWASTIDALLDSPEKLQRKDDEISFADVVIVPSHFVAQSLRLAPHCPKRIEIMPYGAPSPTDRPVAFRADGEPLRVMYAGRLRQGKGLSYLFEALSHFEYPYELLLAGAIPTTPCQALEAALEKPNHRWLGTVPHGRLLKEMARSHVFVLPSLVEGLALVIGEALASGLPVLTTANSGGPELVQDGVEGFIVRIRDPEAITEKLTLLYEDEGRRHAMAEAAKRRAAEMSWTVFEDRVASLVRELIL